jgi:hypothetical protein
MICESWLTSFFLRSHLDISIDDFEKGSSQPKFFSRMRWWGPLGWTSPQSTINVRMSPLFRIRVALCYAPTMVLYIRLQQAFIRHAS